MCIMLAFGVTPAYAAAYSAAAIQDWVVVIEPKFDTVTNFTDAGSAVVEIDGKWGVIDTAGKYVLEPVFEGALTEGSNNTVFLQKAGKWGLYSLVDGAAIVSPKYDRVSSFSEGLAAVAVARDSGGGYRAGYIDYAGNEVIPLKYDEASGFQDGLAYVVDPDQGDAFIIDTEGETVSSLPGVYPWEVALGEPLFNEGVIWMNQEDEHRIERTGAVELTTGEWLIQPEYEAAWSSGVAYAFDNGFAWVLQLNSISFKREYLIYDREGELVAQTDEDQLEGELVGNFKAGLAQYVNENGYGFVNTDGEVVVEAAYDQLHDYSYGLAVVAQDGKYGMIDEEGQIVIPLAYDSLTDMTPDGAAIAAKNGKFGLIDRANTQLTPFKYDDYGRLLDGIGTFRIDGKMVYVTLDGEELLALGFDEIHHVPVTAGNERSYFVNGYGVIRKNGKLGYISDKANSTIPDGGGYSIGYVGGGGNPLKPQPAADGGVRAPIDSMLIGSNGQGKPPIVQLTKAQLAEVVAAAAAARQPTLTLDVGDQPNGISVQLPHSAVKQLKDAGKQSAIVIQSNQAAYELPLAAFDLEMAAKQLGVAAEELKLTIEIAPVPGTAGNALRQSLSKHGLQQTGSAFAFAVRAQAGDRSLELQAADGVYVKRTVKVAASDAAAPQAIVAYNPATGTLSFVPHRLVASEDGQRTYEIPSRHNDWIIAVSKIGADNFFNDLQGHWAKSAIEGLAATLLVQGVSEAKFAPEQLMTRAQFAMLLARALELTPPTAALSASQPFTDVAAGAWYAESIAAVRAAGIVNGVTSHSFAPNATVTREQMAVMFERALAYIGQLPPAGEGASKLETYGDQADVSPWARGAVAALLQTGIITGTSQNQLSPDSYATRAQAAVMLKRFLTFSAMLN